MAFLGFLVSIPHWALLKCNLLYVKTTVPIQMEMGSEGEGIGLV